MRCHVRSAFPVEIQPPSASHSMVRGREEGERKSGHKKYSALRHRDELPFLVYFSFLFFFFGLKSVVFEKEKER